MRHNQSKHGLPTKQLIAVEQLQRLVRPQRVH